MFLFLVQTPGRYDLPGDLPGVVAPVPEEILKRGL